MAVNDTAHVRSVQCLANGIVVHIAQIVRLFVEFALLTHAAGDRKSFGKRLREKALLPGGASHLGPETLVRVIIGAPGVAVRNQHALSEQIEHFQITQQLRAEPFGP